MSKKLQMYLGALALVVAGVVMHNPVLVTSGAQMASEASAQES